MGRDGVRPGKPRQLVVDVVHGRTLRANGLGPWLRRAMPRVAGSVTVALVSDARLRALNRRYRRHDALTDVLSFPVGTESPAPTKGYLGDIVIATGVARRQARRAGHPVQTELRVLALHGLLHLLGHDHETDEGQMARLETRLRRAAGLGAGLIERESAR